jgi:hypothetical protein
VNFIPDVDGRNLRDVEGCEAGAESAAEADEKAADDEHLVAAGSLAQAHEDDARARKGLSAIELI